MILVDTSVWIRSTKREGATELRVLQSLLQVDLVATTDVVVAEVLQGAASEAEFSSLLDNLGALHFFHADEQDWLNAARLSYDLRRSGATTGLSDVVIATVALKHDLEVYAVDSGFGRIPGIRVYRPA